MYTHKFGGSEEEKTNKQNKVLSNKKNVWQWEARFRRQDVRVADGDERYMRMYPIEKLQKRNNRNFYLITILLFENCLFFFATQRNKIEW